MAWLGTWAKRIKCDIDYTNKIGGSVTQFPITIHLKADNGDTENVFTEVGANSQKIAITQSDGTTQLYAEIEEWDNGNSVGIIHCSLSTWTISADTYVYLYYDNNQDDNTAYIGTTAGSSPATNVWDASFKRVYHLNDLTTSTVADSKGLGNGTKKGANEPVEIAGKIGYGQDFDGNDDKIDLTDAAMFGGGAGASGTVEVWFKLDATASSQAFWTYDKSDAPYMAFFFNSTTGINFAGYSGGGYQFELKDAFSDTTNWHYAAGTFKTNEAKLYIDETEEAEDTACTITDATPTNHELGNRSWVAPIPLNGKLDEVRISSVARSAGWIKASYNSGNDTLLTYGVEEGAAGTSIKDIICSNGFIVFPR